MPRLVFADAVEMFVGVEPGAPGGSQFSTSIFRTARCRPSISARFRPVASAPRIEAEAWVRTHALVSKAMPEMRVVLDRQIDRDDVAAGRVVRRPRRVRLDQPARAGGRRRPAAAGTSCREDRSSGPVGFQRFGRVDVDQRRVVRRLDLSHTQLIIRHHERLGAHVAVEACDLGEEAPRPQDRVAPPSVPRRDADRALLGRGRRPAIQLVDQGRRGRPALSARSTSAPSQSSGRALMPRFRDVLKPFGKSGLSTN